MISNIEMLLKTVEIIMTINLPIFAISMFVIINTVRKHNKEIIQSAVTNPALLNFDLSVFSKSRKEYYKIKQTRALLIINFISGVLSILGGILIFLLGFVEIALS